MNILTDPTYPVVGDTITFSATDIDGTAEATRFELTSVPSASSHDTGVLRDFSGAYIQTFTPDVAGEYTVTAYDVLQRIGISSFVGDTNTTPTEQLLDSDTATIYVGDLLELRIETIAGHDATLRLQVNNATVRAASLVEPATDLAQAAILDTAVSAAVAALVDVAVVSLAPTLTARVTALQTQINAHFADSTPHDIDEDEVNVVTRDVPFSDEAALSTLGLIYDALVGHLVAVDPSAAWHLVDDTKNVPVTAKPRDKATATVTLSDLEERVYERHRVQTSSPGSHGSADNTNALAAPTTLTTAIVAYLDYIADNTPDGPSGENEGAVDAEAQFGMTRV